MFMGSQGTNCGAVVGSIPINIQLVSVVLLAAIAGADVARAENNPPQGKYSGGGYRVETGNDSDD